MRVESLESVQKVDSVIVEQRDTLREVTTITIDRNDKGDTLKVVQITDRYRGRDMSDVRSKKEDVRIVHDTVFIQKTDSVYVSKEIAGPARNEGARASPVVSALKWICFIIIGLIALIITAKVCLRKW